MYISHHWNGELHNHTDSKDDLEAEDESNIDRDNDINDLENPEQCDLSAAPNVSRLIQPTRKSNKRLKMGS